jgi:hypothetical protein
MINKCIKSEIKISMNMNYIQLLKQQIKRFTSIEKMINYTLKT